VALADYKPATAGIAGLLLVLASAAANADASGRAAAETAEARIEAIRNALVDRALQSEVRVRGMSWIDESGRLREHTLISSDLKVRGIRVNAYVENDKPRESVLIDAAAAISGNRNCAPPEARLRRPALVDIDYQPKDGHSGQYQLAQIARAVDKQIENDFSGKGTWQLQKQSHLPVHSQLVNFGDRQSAPYLIRITIRQFRGAQYDTNAAAGIFRLITGLPRAQEAPEVAITMSLSAIGTDRVLWSDSTLLSLPAAEVSMQSRQPEEDLREKIAHVVSNWNTRIETLLKCEPVFFNLSVTAGGEHRINAGAAAGIRMRDKFVIVDQTRFPSNVLGEEMLQAVMLAEVESVSRSSARVRILGSHPAIAGGRWVAMPL
jgi:hypothetical protein